MRKIKNHTKQKFIALAVLLILAISIGYAALSTTLTINGTANIAANSWLIYFTNVQVNTGSVTATTAPTTSGTSTTTLTWVVYLQTPGDYYEYNVDVKNDGTIDAMIGSLSNTSLNTNQAKYLNYTVTYSDGATIEQYDKLDSNETVTLKVRVEYKTDLNPEDLPSEPAEITFEYTSNYVQADGNAKARNRNGTPVGYAVQIYGINQDVDADGNTLGLTFGPAVGANYNNSYVTHEYEETSEGSGEYYVKIITHSVAANGSETTSSAYLTDSGSNNVTRSQAQVDARENISLHDMTWAEIKAVQDKTVFEDCMLCGDTKSVSLTLNSTIASGSVYNQYGDGAGMLYNTISNNSYYYTRWNPSQSQNSYVGTGVTLDSNETNYGSNARNAGGYSVSHIRATLIGKNAKTNEGYAGDVNLTSDTCLYSCIESDLQAVITSKKIKFVTGTSTSSYTLNDDIADSIWLFSDREMYGTGQYSGNTTEGLGASGDGYNKFGNTESKYYISSYNVSAKTNRVAYTEAGSTYYWWLRSPSLYSTHSVRIVYYSGLINGSNANDHRGLAFGFCIQ